MQQLPILTSHANQVLSLITQNELDKRDFKWILSQSLKTENTFVSRLVYKKNEFFFFQFDYHQNAHYSYYSPSRERLFEECYPGGWINQLAYVSVWLESLKREISAPNLWELIDQSRELDIFRLGDSNLNNKFQAEEKIRIVDAMKQIQEHFEKVMLLDNEQLKVIEGQLEYLKDVSEKVTKKDWKLMFMGMVFTWIFDGYINQDMANGFFQFVNQLLNWIYNSVGLVK